MNLEVGVIAQIVGMATLLLGGGIALGRLFSDNATIKELLKAHSGQMASMSQSQARLQAEAEAMEAELRRVRDRLDQFVDGKFGGAN